MLNGVIMANHFSIEILAPDGLAGIEESISNCKLGLEPWKSGYNGKVILRSVKDSDFEWSMDSSDGQYLFASGEFYDGLAEAVESLESLSNVLRVSKFPHIIIIDDETNYAAKEIKHDWVERNIT